jgi:large subunit ribosomal protein L20
MVRVTNSVARKRRKNRLFKLAKGFYGKRKNHIRNTKNVLMKAWANAFDGRKEKKRDFRTLWIQRINAASRCYGISYSKLISGMEKANIAIDRKILAKLAVEDEKAFEAVVIAAKKALA